ncbi:zinc finger CCHC domain-containing protein 10-like [Pseudophryne corroboree]|uniref:zinc finger CCHC domain-containing protein 10-like n=1 Tax=Pseudophryne corroboree TaxID=495146 RepID=UPI003081AA22
MADFGQSAGGRASGKRRASAAQRVARACRELGAAAAELELGTDREQQGRELTAHSTRGARRAPQAWAGPSSVLSSTEGREEGDLADFVEDDDWAEEDEDFGSERSMASGELVQAISISTTSSSSHSSSSSSSSSSLASQASDADSTARARREAEKFAKRAAKQQKRRKRRKRLSEEERRAKKRRDLPGVVRCEYTAVMRGLRDSCRKKILLRIIELDHQ